MSLRRALAAMLLASCAGGAQAQSLADALDQGDLICEFREGWRHSLIADLVGKANSIALQLIYESVTPERAAVLSSRTNGRGDVIVRATDAHLHFIERVGPSVRVTTLSGCARSKWKNGVERCVRFPARHAWHFDTRTLVDPDAAYARTASGAAVGSCEPWHLD